MTSRKYIKGGPSAAFFVSVRLLIIFVCQTVAFDVEAQTDSLRVMFYNVENLFDTIDNPAVHDEDFTPTGKLLYNSSRYDIKVEHISKVIVAAFGDHRADIVGLSEVENAAVVADLISVGKFSGFEIVHFDSPDMRGIDNALVYNSNRLSLIDAAAEEVDLEDGERPTRDILWAMFEVKESGAKLIVFVNHWPSRYGGQEKSEWKRFRASETLQSLILKMRLAHPGISMMAMGDFNDYPNNVSVASLESCVGKDDPCLVNLHRQYLNSGKGSHAYKGEWGVLDQILISNNMLDSNESIFTNVGSGKIVHYDWMMYTTKSKELFPSRTYSGPRYYGGYSDHLPVTVTFTLASRN